MAVPKVSVQVTGVEQARVALSSYRLKLKQSIAREVTKFTKETAQSIRTNYNGSGKGFSDRTGELRKSIVGDLEKITADGVFGFVGAGGGGLGTDNRPTREYVSAVEFGQFSIAGDTSFLRPGTFSKVNKFILLIKKAVRPENVITLL